MLEPKYSPELMARVFTHLTPQQVSEVGQTCKTWHAAAHDPTLWRSQADAYFSTPMPANQPDAHAAFATRWTASRAAVAALRAPGTRLVAVYAVAKDSSNLARPHRVQLAHGILQRLEAAIAAGRTERSAVTQGVACAIACVHNLDKPAVMTCGEALQQVFSKARKKLPLKR